MKIKVRRNVLITAIHSNAGKSGEAETASYVFHNLLIVVVVMRRMIGKCQLKQTMKAILVTVVKSCQFIVGTQATIVVMMTMSRHFGFQVPMLHAGQI